MKYLVAYISNGPGGFGCGRSFVTTEGDLLTEKEILAQEEILRSRNNLSMCGITNIVPLKD